MLTRAAKAMRKMRQRRKKGVSRVVRVEVTDSQEMLLAEYGYLSQQDWDLENVQPAAQKLFDETCLALPLIAELLITRRRDGSC